MDSSAPATNRPSPRQLQGPRPPPLKVNKNSHKISKKPPTIPQNPNQPPQNPQPPRAPVIIYTVSPKVIHTNPADFMTLVQRLTGPNSGDPSAAAAAAAADPSVPSPSAASGALSPAARFAAIETAERNSPRNSFRSAAASSGGGDIVDEIIRVGDRSGWALDGPSPIPGILSPMPASLQPISSSFFSPIANFDPGTLSFLNDLSPGPNFGPGSNFLSTPTIISPGSYWDLFGDLP